MTPGQLLVINLFGAPSSGKSTLRARLFSCLKKRHGLRVEEVTEFAKEEVYEGHVLENQLQILSEQYKRQQRLVGKVDICITDSPIRLQLAYCKDVWRAPWFRAAVNSVSDMPQFVNYNVLVKGVRPFEEYGRVHNEAQAQELSENIADIAWASGVVRCEVDGNEAAPGIVLGSLIRDGYVAA